MADSNEEVDRVIVTGSNRRDTRFSLAEFRSELKLNDILQPNRFIAIFSLPRGLEELKNKFGNQNVNPANYVDSDAFISLRCDSVTIPGVNFFTSDDFRRHGIGQIERRPYLPTFNPITMNFIVDRNARVIQFFNDWTNGICNYDTDLGMSPTDRPKPYLLKYPATYLAPTIRIWIYDQTNLMSFGVKLYDAYPLTTSDVSLNWASTNEPLKYSVTMRFSHMTMQFLKGGEVLDFASKDLLGVTPKSASEVRDDSAFEYKSPSLLQNIFSQTSQMIQGEIYSGAERLITKAFDRLFK